MHTQKQKGKWTQLKLSVCFGQILVLGEDGLLQAAGTVHLALHLPLLTSDARWKSLLTGKKQEKKLSVVFRQTPPRPLFTARSEQTSACRLVDF